MAKLEKFVFYFFIFCLPFQTRVILKSWGAGFNEWNSAFLYGTDLLLILLFTLWLIKRSRPEEAVVDKSAIHLPENSRATSRGSKVGRMADLFFSRSLSGAFLLIFLGIAALSITQADNKLLGFYQFIKLLEFVGFYFYVRSSLGKIFTLNRIFLIIVVSGVFQGLVAIGQSLFQHSLGLKWLGESILRTNFSGVAVVATEGEKFLRAYGTTPHPNILAAWLFLAIFACYFLFLREHSRSSLLLIIYPVLLWGFLATFSRIAIALWVLGILVRFLLIALKRKKYVLDQIFKKRLMFLVAVTLAVVAIFCLSYWPQVQSRISISTEEQAVVQRIFYTKIAGKMFSVEPWLGSGLGQFVGTMQSMLKNLPDHLYQPVHNIYLLILNEMGVLGLAAFLSWLGVLVYGYYQRTKFKKLHYASFFVAFLSVLVLGSFDHFLWTLQQGQLILWLTLGLISVSEKTLEVV